MARELRRLAAIVSADVVGYSRLMGRDETGTLSALRAHQAELIDPAVTEYDGRIVKTMGDGLLLEFASVVAATRFAIAVQGGMADRNAGIPAVEGNSGCRVELEPGRSPGRRGGRVGAAFATQIRHHSRDEGPRQFELAGGSGREFRSGGQPTLEAKTSPAPA